MCVDTKPQESSDISRFRIWTLRQNHAHPAAFRQQIPRLLSGLPVSTPIRGFTPPIGPSDPCGCVVVYQSGEYETPDIVGK